MNELLCSLCCQPATYEIHNVYLSNGCKVYKILCNDHAKIYDILSTYDGRWDTELTALQLGVDGGAGYMKMIRND